MSAAMDYFHLTSRRGAGKEYTIRIQELKTDYNNRNELSTPFYHEGGKTATAGTFTRRIGNTVYRVNVHYSKTASETITDKIARLVKNDVSGKAGSR